MINTGNPNYQLAIDIFAKGLHEYVEGPSSHPSQLVDTIRYIKHMITEISHTFNVPYQTVDNDVASVLDSLQR